MYLPTTSGSESKTPEGTNWTIFANVRKHADTSQQVKYDTHVSHITIIVGNTLVKHTVTPPKLLLI